jgi:aromatic ring-opening dioxygenase catalytic subunit (LigB family)
MHTARRLPVFFLSHGGGPWPWMKESTGTAYDALEASLQRIAGQIGTRPNALLMVSAHWEAPAFTVMANSVPPMIYDYGGFPEHTYRVRYPAPGAPPAMVERVRQLIADAGLPVGIDPSRGFDHGVFSPLAVVYPEADVAVFQVSLQVGLDPMTHIALGRALAPLRDEGIVIVGSGLSYHNLRLFGAAAQRPSAAFDAWLQEAMAADGGAARTAALVAWETAPAARQAHPREEHLLPLMVAAGAAGDDPAVCIYHEDAFMGGVTVSSFRFDATA